MRRDSFHSFGVKDIYGNKYNGTLYRLIRNSIERICARDGVPIIDAPKNIGKFEHLNANVRVADCGSSVRVTFEAKDPTKENRNWLIAAQRFHAFINLSPFLGISRTLVHNQVEYTVTRHKNNIWPHTFSDKEIARLTKTVAKESSTISVEECPWNKCPWNKESEPQMEQEQTDHWKPSSPLDVPEMSIDDEIYLLERRLQTLRDKKRSEEVREKTRKILDDATKALTELHGKPIILRMDTRHVY